MQFHLFSVSPLIRTTKLNTMRLNPNMIYILVMITLVYVERDLYMCEPYFHISYISLKMRVRVKFSAVACKSPGFVNPIFKTILRASKNFRVALSYCHLVPIISDNGTWAL